MNGTQLSKYKLSELADVISGVSYKPSDVLKINDKDSIRVLRGGNIQNNHIVFKDDDIFLSRKYSMHNIAIKEGDIVITASTGSVEALGKSARVDKDLSNCYVGAFMRIIRPRSKKWKYIIAMYIQSDYFLRYIRSQAKGTSINNINKRYLEDFPIYIMDEKNLKGVSLNYKYLTDKITVNREINRNLCASRE